MLLSGKAGGHVQMAVAAGEGADWAFGRTLAAIGRRTLCDLRSHDDRQCYGRGDQPLLVRCLKGLMRSERPRHSYQPVRVPPPQASANTAPESRPSNLWRSGFVDAQGPPDASGNRRSRSLLLSGGSHCLSATRLKRAEPSAVSSVCSLPCDLLQVAAEIKQSVQECTDFV